MRYRFGEFKIDTDRFELTRSDETQQLEPQVFALIAHLIENRDRMVSKDELNEEIWKGRFVSDSALSSRIKSARKILGDDGKTQHTIRTIHRKGFRFVADVEGCSNTSDPVVAAQQVPVKAEATGDSVAKPTVAVLPFTNLSSDPEQEYFSDGITSDIIAHLVKHRWLTVTARNTTFGFKGKSVNLIDLARELNVSYLVEGSVQRARDTVRVSVHLIDAHTGQHKWSERYDRKMEDIFSLQDEITSKIVGRLEPEIGYAERHKVFMSRPSNLQAWDCLHLGLYYFYQFTGDGNLEAQRLFAECQTLDSQFGEGYAWWAYSSILGMVYWDTEPSTQRLDQILEACDKALSLDPANAVFHSLKARALLAQKKYQSALEVNRNALELNPTLAIAHCCMGDSLAYEGEYEESIAYFEKAIELSPNDPQLWAFCSYGALALIFKGDFKRALEWTERATNIPNCQYWAVAHKVVAYAYLDNESGMKQASADLLKILPGFNCDFVRQKLFYIKDPKQVEIYLKGLQLAGFD